MRLLLFLLLGHCDSLFHFLLIAEAHTVLLGPPLASVDVNAIEPRSVRIAPLQEV
jgi:hypothetical protein